MDIDKIRESMKVLKYEAKSLLFNDVIEEIRKIAESEEEE